MTRPRHAPGESSQRCDAPLGLKQEVAGVSFSGQQHGSVYWSGGAEALLRAGGAPEEPVAAALLPMRAGASDEAIEEVRARRAEASALRSELDVRLREGGIRCPEGKRAVLLAEMEAHRARAER